MKTRSELNEFVEKAYPLLIALQEMPGSYGDTYGVYTKVKFKPVFYIRPDVLQYLECMAEYSVSCNNTRTAYKRQKATLFGIDVYINDRSGSPMIALALEPTDPYFGRKDVEECDQLPEDIEEIIAANHEQIKLCRRSKRS